MLKIISPAFENNDFIPPKYTCDGDNINPPLQITGFPKGTKSYVLIADDPDALAGVWDHWILYNIEPDISEIKEGIIPEGSIQLQNSFARVTYGGPCPPSGTHHYRFIVYALDKKLNLESNSEKADLLNTIDGHVLARAELIGLYTRE